MTTGRILYLTDKFRISQGYAPAFERLVGKAGIRRNQIITADIYNLVDKPLTRKGQEKLWKFNPEKLDEIRAAFSQRVRAVRPSLIAVSCPAILGVLANGDYRLASIEKMRGGVYEFEGIKVIVVYPITAIHQRVDTRITENDDGEQDKQEPYKVKDGAQILQWDWQKVGRFFHGRERRIPEFRYSICRSIDDCFAAFEFLKNCVLISTDIETGNYPPGITCVGYTGLTNKGQVHSWVIPFFDEFAEDGVFWESSDDHQIALDIVRQINELPTLKCMQNGAYDISYFARDLLGSSNFLLDSMILWWSLYMELPKSLDFISSVLLDNYQYWKDDIKGESDEKIARGEGSMERYWRYNALDTYNTLFNTLYLVTLMQKNKAMQVNYNDALMRMYSGWLMSIRGLKADFKQMDFHRAKLIEAMESKTEELRYIIDEPDFNINSGQQKASLLYDVFGLRMRTKKGRFVDASKPMTGTNAPSAGKIPLKMAKSEHPLFRRVIETLEEALEPRVQMSNIFGFPDESVPRGVRGGLYLPTGRFRYSLNAVGTETTRFSGKKSNFWDGGNPQNIRGAYKDWIVADEDCVFLDVDYSQSDDVFMAYESQDPEKIRVVEENLDAHSYNGELFFGIPYDKIVAGKKAGEDWCVHPITGVRQNSKRIVHGSNFQMAAMTLYVTMGREAVVAAAQVLGFEDAHNWTQEQLVALCGKFMAKYRMRYKRLTKNEYYKEIADELKTKRSLTNAFGITRNFLGDPSDNGTQREATAFIGQSGTAGNMNRVMYEIDWGYIPQTFRDGPNPHRYEKPLKMDWKSHGFRFHLQVHDNFLAQLHLTHPRFKEAAHNLLQVMDRPIIIKGREMRVRAEAELGLRWGKKMLSWDGDVDKLDSLIAKLKFG